MKADTQPKLYGVMAQFDNPSQLVAAAREAYDEGYRQINGYSPFPIEELDEAIGFKRSTLPLIVFAGGVLGALGGFFMQYWMEVVDYPLIVGGKPFNSWPAFIPITFEMTVLCAAFAAVLGGGLRSQTPWAVGRRARRVSEAGAPPAAPGRGAGGRMLWAEAGD